MKKKDSLVCETRLSIYLLYLFISSVKVYHLTLITLSLAGFVVIVIIILCQLFIFGDHSEDARLDDVHCL